jgi:hypothetical protein
MNSEGTRYMARIVYSDGHKYWHGTDGTDWYALMQADDALKSDAAASHAEIVKIVTTHENIGIRSRGMATIEMPRTAEEHDRIMREGIAAR